MGMIRITVLVVVLLVWMEAAECFRRGDTIHMSKRSFHKDITSQWSEMLGKQSPKFGFSKSVKLHALDPNEYASDQPYKIAFSIAGERFITPWITVADGFGTYLQFVEFTFVYAGDEIIEMRWKTDYNTDEHEGKLPEAIYLHFNWEELKEKDIFSGLAVMFVFGFLLGGGILFYIVMEVDAEDRRTKKTPPSRTTPSFAYNNIPSSSFASTIKRISPTPQHKPPTPPPVHLETLDPEPIESGPNVRSSGGDEEYANFVGGEGEFTDFVGDSKDD